MSRLRNGGLQLRLRPPSPPLAPGATWPVASFARKVTATVAAFLPLCAAACPTCARESGGWQTYAVIAAMIFAPYPVAAVVIAVVRRVLASEEGENP